jgi:hypothetical protein
MKIGKVESENHQSSQGGERVKKVEEAKRTDTMTEQVINKLKSVCQIPKC